MADDDEIPCVDLERRTSVLERRQAKTDEALKELSERFAVLNVEVDGVRVTLDMLVNNVADNTKALWDTTERLMGRINGILLAVFTSFLGGAVTISGVVLAYWLGK